MKHKKKWGGRGTLIRIKIATVLNNDKLRNSVNIVVIINMCIKKGANNKKEKKQLQIDLQLFNKKEPKKKTTYLKNILRI